MEKEIKKKTQNVKKKTKEKKIVKKSKNEAPKGLTAPNRLKILITVVDRNKTDFYLDVIESFEVNMQTVIFGRGTAPSHLEFLGLSDQKKAVIVSVIKEEKTKELLQALEEKFAKVKNGKGIAYTIPISSVIGVFIYQFLSNNTSQIKKGN